MSEPIHNNAKFEAVRDDNGRFISTQGRMPGCRNRATKASAQAIESLQDLAFKKLKELLESGHPGIVEFVVKSVLPTGGRVVCLDDMTPEGLTEAAAAGVLSPTELRILATAAAKLNDISKTAELEKRLDALTALLEGGSI